ncbi:hypothetical protein AJ81_08895 [Pseudothermotoga hypogea DSM 11164 = NBRC 106472]|uniref:Thioredoxin n=2 Tax=Pseudothermotoga hypogea TaxID=57487 RepID=A0A0X1KSS2_9THEM|nr:hypothetical protein AJ81_08895 [Pseudothermotoga hypogea DSM 11164 = NBRC 106472]
MRVAEKGFKKRLIVFVEQASSLVSCTPLDLKEINDFKAPSFFDDPAKLSEVLKYIREKHPDVEVETVDPRNPLFTFQVLKHKVKGGRATWVYNGKKVFEGVPTIEQIEKILSETK